MLLIKLVTVLTPWFVKRHLLAKVFGYSLHPTARIGLSWFFPKRLSMGEGARVDHGVVAIHIDEIAMGSESSIGRACWITGFPTGDSRHFTHRGGRKARLELGAHSAITKSHHIDCTDEITIGAFSTVAGYRSQFLTHSIDIGENRQDSKPIRIGSYCFVGTECVILGGSELPDFSVLGAKSLLNKKWEAKYTLYAGVPSRAIKGLDPESGYFTRTRGFVD